MLLAIISDTHDNVPNARKFLDWARKSGIEAIIHCGDLCAPSMLLEVFYAFKGKIHLVFGNVEDRILTPRLIKEGKISNALHYGDMAKIELGGLAIAFVHFPEKARELAESGKHDFVFYGHTHKPWIEEIGKTFLANPGTVSGMFNKATFAVLDTETKKLELKLLEKL